MTRAQVKLLVMAARMLLELKRQNENAVLAPFENDPFGITALDDLIKEVEAEATP